MMSDAIEHFEHNIKKYQLLNENTVGMISGNVLLMDYFLGDYYSQKLYSEILQIIKEKFKQKRLEKVQNKVLNSFSIDFEDVKEILKNPISNQFQNAILKNISKTNTGT